MSEGSSEVERVDDVALDDSSFDESTIAEYPFHTLGLNARICRGLLDLSFEKPTEIQAQVIPGVLTGKDVLGQARTGTGKTAAFGLPLLQAAQPGVPVQALVLVPTRELAMQVETELNKLGKYTRLRTFAVYGGKRLTTQITQLEDRQPEIVIGTPGRVMDLHERRVLRYDNIKWAFLDEVDRMLDIGFRDDIRKILGGMSARKPQFVFVSATIDDEIEKLARRFMDDPIKIVTSEGALTVRQVDQSYIPVAPDHKRDLLMYLLSHEEPDLTLVFCRTKQTVDRIARHIRKNGIDVHALHGDMPQSKRTSIVKQLRAGSLSVVVASDLAARGLDVSGISHVINYDLPEDPEVYVHRIGRTARAGRDGIAWSFVCPDQGELLTAIEMLANIEIKRLDVPGFNAPDDSSGGKSDRHHGNTNDDDNGEEQSTDGEDAAPSSSAYKPEPVWENDPKEIDTTRFPGGVAPKGPPKRRMGGKVKSRRSR